MTRKEVIKHYETFMMGMIESRNNSCVILDKWRLGIFLKRLSITAELSSYYLIFKIVIINHKNDTRFKFSVLSHSRLGIAIQHMFYDHYKHKYPKDVINNKVEKNDEFYKLLFEEI